MKPRKKLVLRLIAVGASVVIGCAAHFFVSHQTILTKPDSMLLPSSPSATFSPVRNPNLPTSVATTTVLGTIEGLTVAIINPLPLTGTTVSPMVAGLVGFWRLEEGSGSRLDEIGGNQLADFGGVGRADGRIGFGAALVPGRYLWHDDCPALRTGGTDFSVSAWIYLDNIDGNQVYVSKFREFALFYSGARFYFATYGSNGSIQYAAAANHLGPPLPGCWYHLVGVHSAATGKNYIRVNAGLADEAVAVEHTGGDGRFMVGALNGNYSFTGMVDAVGVWNRALSPDEIADLYRGALGVEWPFVVNVSPPTVTTGPISSILYSSASASGAIVVSGGENSSARGFEYGLTAAYGHTATQSGPFFTGNFTATLEGLTCNAQYHVRAFAENSAGVAYGDDTIFTTAPCIDSLTIKSPVEWQVFQRRPGDRGDIIITGHCTVADGTSTGIEASWNGGPFTAIVSRTVGGSFSAALADLSAGQGTLVVRLSGRPAIASTIPTVGIGDVFVIAGQSNAVGIGFNLQSYSHPTLQAALFGNDDHWKELRDPVDDNSGQVDVVSNDPVFPRGSVWPLIASMIMAHEQVPVAFIPTAKGGSRIISWLPHHSNPYDPARLYGSMHRRVLAAGGSIKAVLFWQGESDAVDGMSFISYRAYLNLLGGSVFSDFRVKVVAAQIGDYCSVGYECLGPSLDNIRGAQIQAWNEGYNILPGPQLFDVDLLDEGGDGVHFMSDPDITTAADRWWAALEQDFYGGDHGRGPRLLRAEHNQSKTEIFLTFSGGALPLTPASGLDGFLVKRNGIQASIARVTRVADNQLKIDMVSPGAGILTVSFGAGRSATGVTVPTDSGAPPLPVELFYDFPTEPLVLPDSDNDGMPDQWEAVNPCLVNGADDGTFDYDLDGILSRDEYAYSSEMDPCSADSDSDAMPDAWELSYACVNPVLPDANANPDRDDWDNLAEYLAGTEPCRAYDNIDSDSDWLSDYEESNIYFTDPYRSDTDYDYLTDYIEAVMVDCLDPLSEDSDGDDLIDGGETGEDLDMDGVVDVGETDPCRPDTDGDGLPDGAERPARTNSLDWDTDGDGLPDGFEAATSLNPLEPADAGRDDDGDGNPNVHEYWNGTDFLAHDPVGGAGCFYWGDGDGDGFVSPTDVSILVGTMKGLSNFYAQVVPPNGETQELDMDLFRSPSDLAILRSFIRGAIFTTLGSRPLELTVAWPPAPSAVAVGDTTHVTVNVANQAGKSTPGFGVLFTVDPASTGRVTLLGGDGGAGGGRYDISGAIADGSPATIILRADAPGTIVINARLPECGSGSFGRYCPPLASEPVTFTCE